MNPHLEGEYLCYGEDVAMPDGSFAAYYFVKHNVTGEFLLERRRFGIQTYLTADIARLNGVSAGKFLVQSQNSNGDNK